jgi:hypothetical protein
MYSRASYRASDHVGGASEARSKKPSPFFLFCGPKVDVFFFLFLFFINEGRMFFFPTRRSLFALTLFLRAVAQWRKAFRDAAGSV